MLSLKRNHYGKKIRELEKRIASLDVEIKNLESLINNRNRNKNSSIGRPPRRELTESKRRLVSYLSTGSFQTTDLRRHERRSAKVRRVVLAVLIVTIILIIWIWFRG